MLTAALKPDLAPVFTPTTEWVPTEFFEWDNFRRVLTEAMRFLRYMINSTVIVVTNIIGGAALLLPGGVRVRPPGSAGARCSSPS